MHVCVNARVYARVVAGFIHLPVSLSFLPIELFPMLFPARHFHPVTEAH